MKSKMDVERVIDRFDGFWLYGSRVQVHMALRDTRDSFWRKKRSDEKHTDIRLSQNHSDQRNAHKQYLKVPSKLVEGVVDGGKLDILQNCATGFCRHPYRLSDLVKEYRDAKSEGFTVMWIVGSLVFLMFVDMSMRKKVLDEHQLDKWLENVIKWSPQ
ncbi:hypothetical protein V6N12_031344 [Hibiscus sabdariffa]|uniref:Uncharacterized protein n=1 Tax=Hibiscus sabdariffa TaxID=183260 RepID=A0ABR2E8N1_9ROSI